MNLRVSILLLQTVALTWTPSTTPNATTNVFRNNTQIASGLTIASYTDASVAAGSTYTYYVLATAGGAISSPSNSVTLAIPNPVGTLTPTAVSVGTFASNANMTKITVTVTASSGKKVPAGTVTFTAAGSAGTLTLTGTLNAKGQVSQSIATELLQVVPVTITYSGNTNFSASSATIP